MENVQAFTSNGIVFGEKSMESGPGILYLFWKAFSVNPSYYIPQQSWGMIRLQYIMQDLRWKNDNFSSIYTKITHTKKEK